MKSELAESILKEVMQEWKIEQLNEEIKDIQVISEIKYDDYQQYTHGMRYVESLALWLRQFSNIENKNLAYYFVKNNLVYISEEEMMQLVELAYPIIIKPYLMQKTKKMCVRNNIIEHDERRNIYKYFCRKSLFLGLSDGAHLDFFRRQNAFLSNEQVFVHYEFSKNKADDMLKTLTKDIYKLNVEEKYPDIKTTGFDSFILIDDFSASGKSYIRQDDKGWHGKIHKFYTLLELNGYKKENIDIHLILYIATDKAIKYIKKQADLYFKDKKVEITVDVIQMVKSIDMEQNREIDELFKYNYDDMINSGYESYVDDHFDIGNGKHPYWGFADCALSLVIYHNTPNNAFPIYWYSWKGKVNALFPRITRHKEI